MCYSVLKKTKANGTMTMLMIVVIHRNTFSGSTIFPCSNVQHRLRVKNLTNIINMFTKIIAITAPWNKAKESVDLTIPSVVISIRISKL